MVQNGSTPDGRGFEPAARVGKVGRESLRARRRGSRGGLGYGRRLVEVACGRIRADIVRDRSDFGAVGRRSG